MQAQGPATVVMQDHYPPELRQPCLTAVTVLPGRELGGQCAICETTWPCQLQRLKV